MNGNHFAMHTNIQLSSCTHEANVVCQLYLNLNFLFNLEVLKRTLSFRDEDAERKNKSHGRIKAALGSMTLPI